jgi:16S rRNA (guanine527-N7)-methyltransferase
LPLDQPNGPGTQLATPTPVVIDLLDVGSGAGLPGLILAIARPQYRVTMIDAVQKKAAFIAQAIIELGLTNAQAIHGRIENYHPPRPPTLITSRAFAALRDFVGSVERIADAQTIVAAMKGQHPQQEIDELPANWRLVRAESITVPGLDAQRTLIFLRQH